MASDTGSPRAASTPTSPHGSPALPGSGSELTPRSKVRALLALSDDSDFDALEGSPSKTSSIRSSAVKATRHITSRQPSPIVADAANTASSIGQSTSESDEDVVPVRRMGKIVGRLHGKASRLSSPLNESEGDQRDQSPEKRQAAHARDRLSSAPSTPRRPTSKTRSVASSPGLFVSPGPGTPSLDHVDESAAPASSTSTFRRLAPKQQKSRKSKIEKRKRSSELSNVAEDQLASNNEDADSEVEHRLTQQTRVSKRKASKKALEEMHRETQRMARNQQLSHQAQVRKKITKQDLFQRFNFRQNITDDAQQSVKSKSGERSSEDEVMMSGALLSSDADPVLQQDTPPTSPIRTEAPVSSSKKMNVLLEPAEAAPDSAACLESEHVDKKVNASLLSATTHIGKSQKRFRVVMPEIRHVHVDDSDDDLEVTKPNKALAMLQNLPVDTKKDSSHLLRLRHLANLTSPGRKRAKSNHITATELQIQLRQKARRQAMDDKAERIAQLQAKGIHVQTFEEREKEQLELENLLEKARVAAVDIAKKEKAAAKKAGVDVDVDDHFDDDDDEDWDGEDEAEPSEAELAMSGSEDDEAEKDADGDHAADDGPSFFDNEAGESEEEDISQNITEVFSIFKKKPSVVKHDSTLPTAKPASAAMPNSLPRNRDAEDDANDAASHLVREEGTESEGDQAALKVGPRARRRLVVTDDDSEDSEGSKGPSQAVTSPNDAAKAAFGFNAKSSAFGLSQLLDSTLAGADSQDASQNFDPDQDSLAFLRQLPENSAPQFATQVPGIIMVPDSQRHERHEGTREPFTQIRLGISQLPDFYSSSLDMSPTKMSEMIEPTQDAGFALSRLPSAKHEEPASTVDTVMHESPVLKRKGRLMRRTNVVAEQSESDSEVEHQTDLTTASNADAFDALFVGAKKSAARIDFDKKKSAAKELVEEQAEESEDEYAGLGGASDDESNGEIDEEMQEMMDDSNVDVNEQALQALHADKQRLEDEKRLNQLYKDITTGGLRRKRGAAGMDDLSDHEDDVAERRRRKQEEFARMRRALLADEKVGKIAQNPKQQAFFHAIEDRDELAGFDYMDRPDGLPPALESSIIDSSNSQSQDPGSEDEMQKCNVPAGLEGSADKENIPPRHPRRTAPNESVSRPTTLAEIRESLSFFLEDSVPETQLDDLEDLEEFDLSHSLRRSDTNTSMSSVTSKTSVVNRLLRTESQDSMTSKHLAFQAESTVVGPTFKVPSLLRRATNLSTTSHSSTGTSTSTRANDNGIRMGGSRKSNIHYQAREAERKRLVDVADQKRKAQVKRTVMSSKGRSVFGLLRKESSGFE